jgi:nucleotide-binding universal stress UspA family protein
MTTFRPFVEALDATAQSGEGARGRPHVVLVIGASEPRPRAMHDAVWLGRHLKAEMLVVAAVEYRPPQDELVAARVEWTRDAVWSTTEHLVDEGVNAAGTVLVARDGLGPAVVDEFADEHEADLVAVTSQHPSWFWVFPGSGMAHRLARGGRRPVVVIPDHRPGLGARLTSWLEERN